MGHCDSVFSTRHKARESVGGVVENGINSGQDGLEEATHTVERNEDGVIELMICLPESSLTCNCFSFVSF